MKMNSNKHFSGCLLMKNHEKKLTVLAILLTLTLVTAAGVYLIYRAWDYWSADATYANLGRSAVQKMKMTGQQSGDDEIPVSEDSAENGGHDGKDSQTYGQDSSDRDGLNSAKEDRTIETIDGKAVPDKPVIDWCELMKSGEDIVAWLDIPALGIAYPVVQGDDNSYYLHHLPNGEYKNAGSLFMEVSNRPDLSDVNTVIYGHNMDNGSMFGKFRKVTDEDYRRQPFMWICTKEKACLYKMMSIHISHVDDESYTLFELDGNTDEAILKKTGETVIPLNKDAVSVSFPGSDLGNVTKWIRDENRKSYIDMPIPDSARCRVVTLSTCASYSDERRVLQAILVREYSS